MLMHEITRTRSQNAGNIVPNRSTVSRVVYITMMNDGWHTLVLKCNKTTMTDACCIAIYVPLYHVCAATGDQYAKRSTVTQLDT
jgi:hypothetical protein